MKIIKITENKKKKSFLRESFRNKNRSWSEEMVKLKSWSIDLKVSQTP